MKILQTKVAGASGISCQEFDAVGRNCATVAGEGDQKTMHILWTAVCNAAIMAWETYWALVLGFGVSAGLQVFVKKEQMSRLFGRATFGSVIMAMGFGAASSSCSYAAAAAARSAFRQGAALIPALAFMFASTNLVIELGAVLWVLMGWRFVLAETVGAFVLVALLWLFARIFLPNHLVEQARAHAGVDEEGCCHHTHADSDGSPAMGRWDLVADAFVMDWQMLWKEIVIGFMIAGFLMAMVPLDGWKALFLQNGPGWLRLLENALAGPLIAIASFVCSVGNIPLASVLWSSGISFGGVITFIYADLLIVPLILIYRKYYGARMAISLVLIFFAAIVGAGIAVDLLFGALHLIPTGPRPPSMMTQAHFAWNYTTWLDLAALIPGALFLRRHLRSRSDDPLVASGSHHESCAH